MADTERIYHNRSKTYERELKKLHEWNTSARNKELIGLFQNYMFSRDSGHLRVSKLSSELRRMCLLLEKDLDKVLQIDIQNLVAYYNRQDTYSDATKADYRCAIKQFYGWFKELDERFRTQDLQQLDDLKKLYHYIEKEISRSAKLKIVDFSNIISDDEVNNVISLGCRTIKQKAFLKSLHETGCRVGEFLNIKIKDVVLMKNRALIVVDGKTGERRIPIIHSVPYLVQWLEFHPFKNNKESYLWIGESMSNLYLPLKHRGAQKMLDACFDRAGMTEKKHNFHWFRHSRATLLAPKLTEVLICKYMGWTLGSKQVRRYVHLCTEQLEDAILEMNGLKDEERKETEKPQTCVCGTLNTSIARYCHRCGNPLTIAGVIQDQEIIKAEIDDRLKVYADIMADPLKKAEFEKFKAVFFAR